jgi:hypothetical protein
MTANSELFDCWVRGPFVAMNTELENLYFAQPDRIRVIGAGDAIKGRLRDEGQVHVAALLAEGNTGDGFESGFNVLGNVGMYLASLRRHELTNPAREERSPFAEASSLALHVGASLGMAPRFATSHLATHNKAIAGVRKSFTSLPDEFLFMDENTRGILGFQRAAAALTGIVHLGISSPVADVLFEAASEALRDVLAGLCRASDTYYAQLLVDKMLFMLPSDQARLRECMTYRSLLDELLELADNHAQADWFQKNGRAFLEVCDLFGQTAAQHHDQLVRRFIATPAARLSEDALQDITASGPPLPVLLRSLEVLRDMRTGAKREDISTRHADLARLGGLIIRAD